MKNLKFLLSGTGLVVLLFLMMSLFVSNTVQAQDNNGVTVEVIKGADYWILVLNCSGFEEKFESEKNTEQWKNEDIHMSTYIWTLPPGHCAIPNVATKKYFGGGEFNTSLYPKWQGNFKRNI